MLRRLRWKLGLWLIGAREQGGVLVTGKPLTEREKQRLKERYRARYGDSRHLPPRPPERPMLSNTKGIPPPPPRPKVPDPAHPLPPDIQP